MGSSSLLGIILLVLGAVLFGVGIFSTLSVTEQVVEGVSGRYSDHTLRYVLGGIALVIAGAVLAFSKRSQKE
jgi:hypothetical protein